MNQPLAARLLAAIDALRSRAAVATARFCGARIGPRCILGPDCDLRLGMAPPRRGVIEIGPDARLDAGVILHPHGGTIRLGRDVFLGPGVVIYGHGGVEIGDECLIAMHCRILSAEHALAPAGVAIRTQPDLPKPTRLGRDVWLGAGVTVTAGVTIGEGCVIGAGAVVTKDLPPFSIAVGAPARVVGRRPEK